MSLPQKTVHPDAEHRRSIEGQLCIEGPLKTVRPDAELCQSIKALPSTVHPELVEVQLSIEGLSAK